MTNAKLIPVTCALIERNKRILAVQRSLSMPLPGKWEFPGGKVESNESLEECIIREIKEELDADIEILRKLTPVEEGPIKLIPFHCKLISESFILKEHANSHWCDVFTLKSLDWAKADIPIVEEYLQMITP